ncbi:MAG: sigma-70 family RNA polymerase sigma factor [Thermomicrobiales bacterium]
MSTSLPDRVGSGSILPDALPAEMTANGVRLPAGWRQADRHTGDAAIPASPTDVALMVRLAEGDADALSALYDRHAPAVFGLTRAILRDARIAEEATHDVFLGLWQRPEHYEPSRGPFVGWLLRVARNRAIDLLRRDREQPFAAAPSTDDGVAPDPAARLVDPDPDPAEQAFATVQREEVRRAIAGLTVEQQRLLGLAYFSGLTQREIALHVGRPLGTVKTQIRTAMQRLADILVTTDPALMERMQNRSGNRASKVSEQTITASTNDGEAPAER